MNLSGEWIGHYCGHFDQVIKVEHNGSSLRAVKVTGDDFIPAGEPTWEGDLSKKEFFGHIAEKEYRNPRRVPGRLIVHSPERITFQWMGCGEVEFRKDD